MAQGHPKFLWWNGRQMPWDEATVHVTDLGWSTVGAIFEGIRAYWNPDQQEAYIFRLPEHMRRFGQSMKVVRLQQEYPTDQLINAIVTLVRENDSREDTYIRPLAYRGDGDGKSIGGFGSASQILINTHAMPSHLLKGKRQAACISSWTRISDNVMPPRVKNLSNYRNGQLAGMEAAANGYDVAILLNNHGQVAEGGGSCLMMVRDGKLITPDTSSSILESITRDAIMRMAREDLGIEVVERTVERTELYVADEVFMCGTAAEITPVTSVDRYQVGDGELGPITAKLEKMLHDIMRGIDDRHADWRTPVGLGALARA